MDQFEFKHLEDARELFLKDALDASDFVGCTPHEVESLLLLQKKIIEKSYQDYRSMIEYCSTAYIFAMEYRKRKRQFAEYAAQNSNVQGAVNKATVAIYRKAMAREIEELHRYFYIFVATDADRARTTPGRITPDPEEVFERYYSGYSGCLSAILLGFVMTGCLLSLV